MTSTTVSNKKKRRLPTEPQQQAIAVIVTVIAGLVVIGLRAPNKWITAIFVTVVTFGAIISLFGTRWFSARFWAVLAACLTVHLVLLWWILELLLQQRRDVGLVVCVPFMLVEYFVIYHIIRFTDRGSED
jgi:apolipoprotein N-acyltransferase